LKNSQPNTVAKASTSAEDRGRKQPQETSAFAGRTGQG